MTSFHRRQYSESDRSHLGRGNLSAASVRTFRTIVEEVAGCASPVAVVVTGNSGRLAARGNLIRGTSRKYAGNVDALRDHDRSEPVAGRLSSCSSVLMR